MAKSNIKYLLALIILITAGCATSEFFDSAEQFEKDVAIITDYIEEYNIEATEIGASGIFIEQRYIDLTQTESPNFDYYDDSITYVDIAYKGYFTDGTIFDQSAADTTVRFALDNLISGWQIGIPQMTAGDSVTLYVPSYHGYGNYGYASIPQNAVLFFDIYLKSFENEVYQ